MIRLENVLKISFQDVLKTSSKRLEEVLKMSWRRLENILKMSWRRLEDIWSRRIYWSWPRRLEDVLNKSCEDVWLRQICSSRSRSLEDVLKTSSEDEDERRVFKASSRRLHQDGCLLGWWALSVGDLRNFHNSLLFQVMQNTLFKNEKKKKKMFSKKMQAT